MNQRLLDKRLMERRLLLNPEDIQQWLLHWRSAVNSLAEYVAKPIPARVRLHLFLAQDSADTASERSFLGWDTLITPSQIEKTVVPGEHSKLMETPWVETLAYAVSQSLRRLIAAPYQSA
jgi:thioesterase domain-containing protein